MVTLKIRGQEVEYVRNYNRQRMGWSFAEALAAHYQPGEVVFNGDQTVRIRGILHHYNHLLAELSNGGEHAED